MLYNLNSVIFLLFFLILIQFFNFFPEAIGEKISNVEKLLLEYEDAIERVDLEQKKYGEKLELSVLVEKRQ